MVNKKKLVRFNPNILLKKLETVQEYPLPPYKSSLFILPNGKMVGSTKVFDHVKIMEKVMKKKLTDDDLINILLKTKIGKLLTNDTLLIIGFGCVMNTSQRRTLKDLIAMGKYDKFSFNCVDEKFERSGDLIRQTARILGI